MRLKAYPACVLFCVVIAASALYVGRVALRAVHFSRPRSFLVAAAHLLGLTAGLAPVTDASVPPLQPSLTTAPATTPGPFSSVYGGQVTLIVQ
jgi:hypothetical protein